MDRPGGMTVLLTRRTDKLKRHPGQVAFPGGRAHEEDSSPEHTALREAEEEIGLAPGRVELIGRLNVRYTGTGFRVTPIVGLIVPPVELRADPSEVAHIFEVPLADVLDPANHRLEVQIREGRERAFHVLEHPEHYIWGLTARMLVNLREVLES
jgi:8-oxo-dGTP pyrophosphatase MutT (NUDIX family)